MDLLIILDWRPNTLSGAADCCESGVELKRREEEYGIIVLILSSCVLRASAFRVQETHQDPEKGSSE